MANGETLEIQRFSITETTLTYWDWRHGQDVVIVLLPSGAFQRTYTDDPNDDPVLTPIDLQQTLVELANRLANDAWREANGNR